MSLEFINDRESEPFTNHSRGMEVLNSGFDSLPIAPTIQWLCKHSYLFGGGEDEDTSEPLTTPSPLSSLPDYESEKETQSTRCAFFWLFFLVFSLLACVFFWCWEKLDLT